MQYCHRIKHAELSKNRRDTSFRIITNTVIETGESCYESATQNQVCEREKKARFREINGGTRFPHKKNYTLKKCLPKRLNEETIKIINGSKRGHMTVTKVKTRDEIITMERRKRSKIITDQAIGRKITLI